MAILVCDGKYEPKPHLQLRTNNCLPPPLVGDHDSLLANGRIMGHPHRTETSIQIVPFSDMVSFRRNMWGPNSGQPTGGSILCSKQMATCWPCIVGGG